MIHSQGFSLRIFFNPYPQSTHHNLVHLPNPYYKHACVCSGRKSRTVERVILSLKKILSEISDSDAKQEGTFSYTVLGSWKVKAHFQGGKQ